MELDATVALAFLPTTVMTTLVAVMFMHVQASYAICRAAVYIECVLEPRLSGTGWIGIHRSKASGPLVLSGQASRLCVVAYFGALMALSWMFYPALGPWQTRILLIQWLLTTTFGVLSLVLLRYERVRRAIRASWSIEHH